ncbi:MAG: diguanylate cyclase response regulator [Gemmataceae bacterium]
MLTPVIGGSRCSEVVHAGLTAPAVINLLLVDDSREDRTLIRTLLAHHSAARYEIVEGNSAADAYRLAHSFRPDAVILDYRLPGEDGLTCLERLIQECGEAAYIILTGQGDEAAAVRALKAGAADYLVKDHVLRDPGFLDRAVRAAVHTRRLERENARLLETLRLRNQELELLNQKLWELSHTDELTGHFNRRYITARLEEEVARSARYGTPLSIVLADVDHFKRINDMFGHLVGDQALKAVANLFRSCQRDTDLIGRFGGEEFLLILTNTDLAGAEQFCNRLREQLARTPLPVGDRILHLTASFGIAQYGPDCPSLHALLRQADSNLYAAKAAGRNRVVAGSYVPASSV